MKIEIWSDIVCPFCYIGKRRLEKALATLQHTEEIELIWKSFQLNPQQVTQPGISVLDDLARSKGWSIEQTRQITQQVTQMAAEEGLQYNFDAAVVANSLQAHRILQFAKTQKLGTEMKEALLCAYFIDGENIDDPVALQKLATNIGIDATAVDIVLRNTQQYLPEIEADITEAQQLGLRGVPYFIFDRKIAISGAQHVDVFVEALNKVLI